MKTFEEFWLEYNCEAHTGLPIFSEDDRILAEDLYKAGIEEAKKHFEAEKVKIHKYYEEHIHLLTETQPVKGDETNHGKLT